MKHVAAGLLAVCLLPHLARGQSLDGYASVMLDVFPNLTDAEDRSHVVTEVRTRIAAEYRRPLGERVHLTAAGFVDGLAANRVEGATGAAIVRPQEAHVELRWPVVDLRLGYTRIAWGRLDEFQPTDVINPLDLTRFFLEGRSEARMAVPVARARWIPSERFSLEGIYVPFFSAGSYDQLEERTAPFNPATSLAVPITRHEPPHTLGNASGGARATVTAGRVDWSVSAYRGFESLPLYSSAFEEQFPRFTMVGGDFETVRSEWGVRGEAALFVDRSLQSEVGIVQGRAFEGGAGLDRKAGSYRISGNLLVSHKSSDGPIGPGLPELTTTDVNLVASVDRSFARETRAIRAFAVYNPGEQSAFARVVASFNLRDNVSLETSAGLFTGDGSDALARLADRDFVYMRLKAFF